MRQMETELSLKASVWLQCCYEGGLPSRYWGGVCGQAVTQVLTDTALLAETSLQPGGESCAVGWSWRGLSSCCDDFGCSAASAPPPSSSSEEVSTGLCEGWELGLRSVLFSSLLASRRQLVLIPCGEDNIFHYFKKIHLQL